MTINVRENEVLGRGIAKVCEQQRMRILLQRGTDETEMTAERYYTRAM
jgi:hypothetical protein